MSKTRSRAVALLLAAFFSLTVMEDGAQASKGASQYYNNQSSEPQSLKNQMSIDLGVSYVRDMQPDSTSDTAARLGIGGMFNEWLGMDGQGMFELRSKNYLVGGDLRLVPVDWFFLRGGAGVYADKLTNTMSVTPMFGAGILARMTRDVYIQTETGYFSAAGHDNISFGISLGTSF